MSVTIKSTRGIDLIGEAGRIPAITHEELTKAVRPGVSTMSIDRLGEKIIRSHGYIPLFKNYNDYPASICAPVNDGVVHGIPSKKRILQESNIVSLDAEVIYKGFHSDAVRIHAVGEISQEAEKLIRATRQSSLEETKYVRPGNHLNDISSAIAAYAEKFGYSVARGLVGHEISSHLHEDPEIPNFPQRRKGIKLRAGITLAVEPVISAGRLDVEWLGDDQTVATEDGSPSAHYENTILICDDGPEILSTLSSDGKSLLPVFGEKE